MSTSQVVFQHSHQQNGHAASHAAAHSEAPIRGHLTDHDQDDLLFDDSTPHEAPQESEKLSEVINQAHTILFRASTVFPFTIFPTEIIIDETKLNVIDHFIFKTGVIHSIELENILNLQIVTGFLFGTLRIEQRMLPEEPIVVSYLWRHDAIEARRIIQGLVISSHKGVDFSKIDPVVVKDSLTHVGEAKNTIEDL